MIRLLVIVSLVFGPTPVYAQTSSDRPTPPARRSETQDFYEQRERVLKQLERLRAQDRADAAAGNLGVRDAHKRPFEIGRRPPSIPTSPEAEIVTDEQIGKAIQKGVDYLLRQFDEDGLVKGMVRGAGYAANFDKAHFMGTDALAVYALLQCGQAIDDPRLNVRGAPVKRMLEQLRKLPPDGAAQVYARALRATALAVHNRPEDRQTLVDDARWLMANHRMGAWTYGDEPPPDPRERVRSGDNSNAQYGLLGVWSAAEVGVEVPPNFWKDVEDHWIESQLENGQWDYTPTRRGAGPRSTRRRDGSSGTYSMTLAGIASLFVTHDYLDAPRFGMQVGRPPMSPSLQRGMQWLEQGNNWRQDMGPGLAGWGGGYNAYGLERVGLASGFKYIGRHDWYRELAETVLDWQKDDGSFGDLVETCYSLLFLARGRAPILMNKLRFDGAWANRPRDLSNLTRFARRELERALNWQIVPADRDYSDWLDAPILYIASHQAPQLTDEQIEQVRKYVEAGGLLFTHADGANARFNEFVVKLREKVCPAFEFADLSPDDELYTLNFQVEPKPKLRYVTNGVRILWVHSPEDLSQHWQLRAERGKRNSFDLGVNLFLYAAGKRDLRNRLSTLYVPEPLVTPFVKVPVARVKYAGNYDPEPYGLTHFARSFQYATGYGLDVQTVAMDALDAKATPIALLTGTAAYTPTDAEVNVVRKFVNDGGVLLIDSAGGATAFAGSVAGVLLPRAFDKLKPAPVPATHPILVGGADAMADVSRPQLRPYVVQKLGRSAARLEMMRRGPDGKQGAVIVTPLDLTLGLVGANTFSVMGWHPSTADALVRNVILWTWDGKPDGAKDAPAVPGNQTPGGATQTP